MDATALDLAMGQGADTAGQDEWAFWRAFADAELFLLLLDEPKGGALRPQVFDVTDGRLVLVFDREDRLAAFSPVAVPYAALPGRVVAQLALGQGLSVGVNLGSGAASETVLPTEALAWLIETLEAAPSDEAADVPQKVAAPVVDAAGLRAVEAAMAGAAGLADEALLAQVAWASGRQGALLAFAGVALPDQPAVARAVAQALVLSGLDAARLDVAFPDAGSALMASLRRVGRRYVPQTPPGRPQDTISAPGMDKARPPILK